MKNIFKRSLCLLTAILILCASASAAAPQEALDIPEISPRYAYIRDTEADLEITGGLANCSASVSAPTSSYDVELTVELQQNRSGWDTIKTWTDAGHQICICRRELVCCFRIRLSCKGNSNCL